MKVTDRCWLGLLLTTSVASSTGLLVAQTPRRPIGPAPKSPAQAQRPIPKHDPKKLRTLPSSLQIAELQAGKGVLPRTGDRVKVHMTAWQADGSKQIETTEGRKPSWQTVGLRMLPGLAEGLTQMRNGGRYKLIVPPQLAFGDKPGLKSGVQNKQVPPKTTLIFEVVVLEHQVKTERLPGYQRVPAEKLRKLGEGLSYAVLKAGAGEPLTEDQHLELHFALFNEFGMLIASDAIPGAGLLDEKIGLKFLERAGPVLRRGGRYRFVVEPELCYGDVTKSPLLPGNSVTHWDLEVARTRRALEVPEFERPRPGRARVTKSGLRVAVVKEGEGRVVKATDTVRVHFAGWDLRDGRLFDSSYATGKPAAFDLRTALAGVREGVVGMKVGGVRRLIVPGHLGYGVAGREAVEIGPNATLLFHIELLGVQ